MHNNVSRLGLVLVVIAVLFIAVYPSALILHGLVDQKQFVDVETAKDGKTAEIHKHYFNRYYLQVKVLLSLDLALQVAWYVWKLATCGPAKMSLMCHLLAMLNIVVTGSLVGLVSYLYPHFPKQTSTSPMSKHYNEYKETLITLTSVKLATTMACAAYNVFGRK